MVAMVIPVQGLWANFLLQRTCHNIIPAYLPSLWKYSCCHERPKIVVGIRNSGNKKKALKNRKQPAPCLGWSVLVRPAFCKKKQKYLAVIRKIAYNPLRIAIIKEKKNQVQLWCVTTSLTTWLFIEKDVLRFFTWKTASRKRWGGFQLCVFAERLKSTSWNNTTLYPTNTWFYFL